MPIPPARGSPAGAVGVDDGDLRCPARGCTAQLHRDPHARAGRPAGSRRRTVTSAWPSHPPASVAAEAVGAWKHALRRGQPPAPRQRPGETAEWIDAFDDVVEVHGRTRARYLLMRLLERARARTGRVPGHRLHPVCQHHPHRRGAQFPGDEDIERRIRAFIRWNAAVWWCGPTSAPRPSAATSPPTPAPPPSTRSASTTSSAARTKGAAGDQVFFQGHASPGIYARAFVEGRLTEEQLDNFRFEVGGRRAVLLPPPPPMPEFWEFPTVSMGLGPINAISQAHMNRYLARPGARRHLGQPGVGLRGRRRVRRARDDRRPGHGRPRTPRQPDLRGQLQPPAAGRPGAGQRQGHPGVRGAVPGRGLERDQGDLGPDLGRAAGQGRRRGPPQEDELDRRRRLPEVRHRVGRLHPRAFLRSRPAAPGLVGPSLRRGAAVPAPGWPRLPEALCRLPGRHRVRGAPRPPSWPRPSRAGRSAPRSRPATPPTRSRR